MRIRSSALIAFFALITLMSAGPAPAALIARWSFDENGGTVTEDSIGDVDGTLEGEASFAPGDGIAGGAISFVASTNDRVDMGDSFAFTGTAPSFSFQIWVRTTQTTGSIVLGRHVATVVAGYWIGLNDTNDGSPSEPSGSFHFYQSDVPSLNSGDVDIDDGQWHQLVAARDSGAGRLRLYVDGQRVPTAESDGDLHSINATSAPFLVGGLVVGENEVGAFDGLADEVRVWDHALNDTEVLFVFEHPDAINPVLCGDANLTESLTATDALVVLRTAVGTASCSLCICDANGSTAVTATDSLLVLKRAVGQDVTMSCPLCVPAM